MLLVHQVQLHPTLPLLLFSSEISPQVLMGSKWQSRAINVSLLVLSHFNPIHFQTLAHHYYETDYGTVFILNNRFFFTFAFPFLSPISWGMEVGGGVSKWLGGTQLLAII